MAADIVPIRSAEPEPVVALTLTQGVRDISERLMNGELATTAEDLGRDLAMVRDARRFLGMLEERLEGALAEAMPTKVYPIPGVGVFERKRSTDRRAWDTHALLRECRRVAQRQNVDMGTGEMQMSSDEALMHVIEAAFRLEPRITALRGYEIDPDDYCASSPGRTRVTYTPTE